jgi:hypothetical protein
MPPVAAGGQPEKHRPAAQRSSGRLVARGLHRPTLVPVTGPIRTELPRTGLLQTGLRQRARPVRTPGAWPAARVRTRWPGQQTGPGLPDGSVNPTARPRRDVSPTRRVLPTGRRPDARTAASPPLRPRARLHPRHGLSPVRRRPVSLRSLCQCLADPVALPLPAAQPLPAAAARQRCLRPRRKPRWPSLSPTVTLQQGERAACRPARS